MKFALVYSMKKSSWKSCQFITANLENTYRYAFSNETFRTFDLNTEMTEYEIYSLAKDIINYNPTHLIFIDHRPHPELLIEYLSRLLVLGRANRFEVVFHIFGDFTLYAKKWLSVEKSLKNFKVKWVAASERQKKLVSKFLTTDCFKCPFPVDGNEFSYSSKKRKLVRKKLGFENSEVVFLYTGRMSLQKQVLSLIKDFSIFLKKFNLQATLLLAGEFDDLGNPFTGIYYENGEFFQEYLKLLGKIGESEKKKIIYLGNLSSTELNDIYQASDCFVSLSVHNDEDFGMSPAEAICTGLPAILSDWAGYASFVEKINNESTLIPIEMREAKLAYDSILLVKKLFLYSTKIEKIRSLRERIAEVNKSNFEIRHCKKTIRDIIFYKSEPFNGFTKRMHQLKEAFESDRPPFLQLKTDYSKLYRELYDSYLSKEL